MNGLDFGTAIGLIKGLGSPDPAVIESAVSDWLDDHPEATTTVQDGSITKAKLDSNLQGTVDDVADLKSHVTQLDDIMFPYDPALITEADDYALDATFKNFDMTLLKKGNKYRINLAFSAVPAGLSSIRTATGTSGSTVVDDITNLFTGDSWTDGKYIDYIPSVDGIRYLRIQFNSAYQGIYTADISVYDIEPLEKTALDTIDKRIDSASESIVELLADGNAVDVSRAYNLLPPYGYSINKRVSRTGELEDNNGTIASDYIEINPLQGYICNYTKTASIAYDPTTGTATSGNFNTFDRFSYAFYDADKVVIPYESGADAISKPIPQNAKYIRVTILSEDVLPLARLIYGNYTAQPIVRIVQYKRLPKNQYDMPNTGYERFNMVMFGDSITHGSLSVSDDGTSYVDYANDYINGNILNVGFGGTRATYTLSGAGLFCFYHLCECIVSDDANVWDDLVSYAENGNTTYLPHLQKLMAVDWSKVNAIGLMYGANDFTSNTPVGSAYNETVTNYDGAIAYGIKLLVEKYPHLQVLILAPFDRMMEATDPETMTDTTPNTAGLYMYDYADSLIHVAKHFHCPCINTNDLFQMDQYRILLYASDGTHPRSDIAQFRLGWLFAQTIKRYLSPV